MASPAASNASAAAAAGAGTAEGATPPRVRTPTPRFATALSFECPRSELPVALVGDGADLSEAMLFSDTLLELRAQVLGLTADEAGAGGLCTPSVSACLDAMLAVGEDQSSPAQEARAVAAAWAFNIFQNVPPVFSKFPGEKVGMAYALLDYKDGGVLAAVQRLLTRVRACGDTDGEMHALRVLSFMCCQAMEPHDHDRMLTTLHGTGATHTLATIVLTRPTDSSHVIQAVTVLDELAGLIPEAARICVDMSITAPVLRMCENDAGVNAVVVHSALKALVAMKLESWTEVAAQIVACGGVSTLLNCLETAATVVSVARESIPDYLMPHLESIMWACAQLLTSAVASQSTPDTTDAAVSVMRARARAAADMALPHAHKLVRLLRHSPNTQVHDELMSLVYWIVRSSKDDVDSQSSFRDKSGNRAMLALCDAGLCDVLRTMLADYRSREQEAWQVALAIMREAVDDECKDRYLKAGLLPLLAPLAPLLQDHEYRAAVAQLVHLMCFVDNEACSTARECGLTDALVQIIVEASGVHFVAAYRALSALRFIWVHWSDDDGDQPPIPTRRRLSGPWLGDSITARGALPILVGLLRDHGDFDGTRCRDALVHVLDMVCDNAETAAAAVEAGTMRVLSDHIAAATERAAMDIIPLLTRLLCLAPAGQEVFIREVDADHVFAVLSSKGGPIAREFGILLITAMCRGLSGRSAELRDRTTQLIAPHAASFLVPPPAAYAAAVRSEEPGSEDLFNSVVNATQAMLLLRRTAGARDYGLTTAQVQSLGNACAGIALSPGARSAPFVRGATYVLKTERLPMIHLPEGVVTVPPEPEWNEDGQDLVRRAVGFSWLGRLGPTWLTDIRDPPAPASRAGGAASGVAGTGAAPAAVAAAASGAGAGAGGDAAVPLPLPLPLPPHGRRTRRRARSL